jgi:LacI family transcriptional regulator
VVSALRFIREHSYRPLRVDDVLQHVSISRRALERRFHASLGRGLGEEIRANQAGFTSQPQLSRVFHQDCGLTPTAFRRHSRNRGL